MDELTHCLDYLARQHVLTLCTYSGDECWAAHCFYALDRENISFWLMTEPSTCHGRLMVASPQVVGTVSEQTESVSTLQGVQFRGEIVLAEGEDYQRGLAAYQQRFPIAKKKIAPLWVLRLDTLKMTDNSLGFGTKLHWQRPE
ncbi:YhbP family protein [Rosenbergiella australiborealis]|uniref:YhbP family protein n=1 Tax=Rosenbergiella australiborealis TaxID=1544696 RepID=UPI001F4EC7ED|nr:YhbP family protein [Rosenbergiella australiborealis]